MRRLAPLAVALAAAVIFTARPTYDPDLFWHLAQGREVLAGQIVRTNLLSATAPDYPQQYTSWAFDAALAGSAGGAGLLGVQALQVLLLTAALLILYASARVRSAPAAAIAVLLLSLFVIEPRAMPRPYLASWIGLSACVYAIERWSLLGLPRVLPILPILLVWSNFHSEVVFGVALIGLYGVCELVAPFVWSRAAALRVIGIGVLALVATVATPYGIGMWRYLNENALVARTLRIAELQAPALDTYPAFFAYLLVLAVLLAVSPKRSRLSEIAVIVTFTLVGLRYIRFTPMVVFATAPILASRIDAVMQRGWDRRAIFATVAAIMMATLPASPLRMARAWRVGAAAVAPADVFSADAIAFAREHQLSGPVFTSMNLGGYVAWMLPEARVFQDSRLQAYPPAHFTAILQAAASPERWSALVSGVDWAMVSRARPNELSGVEQFAPADWTTVFKDRAVEILVRRNGRFASAISR